MAGLRWVDQVNGVSFRSTNRLRRRAHVEDFAAMIKPRRGGATAIPTRCTLALDDGDGQPRSVLPDAWNDPLVRFNNGVCVPYECLYVRTIARVPSGRTWRPDRLVTYKIDSATSIDSPTRRVAFFDYPGGTIPNRTMFVDTTNKHGVPHGLTVDFEGGVCVALWGGSPMRRYVEPGEPNVVAVPVSGLTALTFGGTNLSELYIAISASGLDTAAEPSASSLVAFSSGIRPPDQRLRRVEQQ